MPRRQDNTTIAARSAAGRPNDGGPAAKLHGRKASISTLGCLLVGSQFTLTCGFQGQMARGSGLTLAGSARAGCRGRHEMLPPVLLRHGPRSVIGSFRAESEWPLSAAIGQGRAWRTAQLTKARSSGEGEAQANGAIEESDPDERRDDIFCSPPAFLRSPLAQALALVSFYVFHVMFLCRKTVDVPLSLLQPIMSKVPDIVALSWEVVFGSAVVLGYLAIAGGKGRGVIAQFLSGKGETKLPTKAPQSHKQEMPETLMLLGLGYLASGYMGQAIDLLLCCLAVAGVPLTLGVSRALQVLLSHLFWVVVGSWILQSRTKDFYTSTGWFRLSFFCKNVMWQTVLGYWMTSFVSTFAININSMLRFIEFPILKQITDALQALPESATENILDQLKNPEGSDMAATVLGAIGPCFTGPIWEELLYRGFLLQALAMFMTLSTAVDVRARKVTIPPNCTRCSTHFY